MSTPLQDVLRTVADTTPSLFIANVASALASSELTPKLIDQVIAAIKQAVDAICTSNDPQTITSAIQHLPNIFLTIVKHGKYSPSAPKTAATILDAVLTKASDITIAPETAATLSNTLLSLASSSKSILQLLNLSWRQLTRFCVKFQSSPAFTSMIDLSSMIHSALRGTVEHFESSLDGDAFDAKKFKTNITVARFYLAHCITLCRAFLPHIYRAERKSRDVWCVDPMWELVIASMVVMKSNLLSGIILDQTNGRSFVVPDAAMKDRAQVYQNAATTLLTLMNKCDAKDVPAEVSNSRYVLFRCELSDQVPTVLGWLNDKLKRNTTLALMHLIMLGFNHYEEHLDAMVVFDILSETIHDVPSDVIFSPAVHVTKPKPDSHDFPTDCTIYNQLVALNVALFLSSRDLPHIPSKLLTSILTLSDTAPTLTKMYLNDCVVELCQHLHSTQQASLLHFCFDIVRDVADYPQICTRVQPILARTIGFQKQVLDDCLCEIQNEDIVVIMRQVRWIPFQYGLCDGSVVVTIFLSILKFITALERQAGFAKAIVAPLQCLENIVKDTVWTNYMLECNQAVRGEIVEILESLLPDLFSQLIKDKSFVEPCSVAISLFPPFASYFHSAISKRILSCLHYAIEHMGANFLPLCRLVLYFSNMPQQQASDIDLPSALRTVFAALYSYAKSRDWLTRHTMIYTVYSFLLASHFSPPEILSDAVLADCLNYIDTSRSLSSNPVVVSDPKPVPMYLEGRPLSGIQHDFRKWIVPELVREQDSMAPMYDVGEALSYLTNLDEWVRQHHNHLTPTDRGMIRSKVDGLKTML